jgi:hypothetical protein
MMVLLSFRPFVKQKILRLECGTIVEWESQSLQNSGGGHEGIPFCGGIHARRVLYSCCVSPEEF